MWKIKNLLSAADTNKPTVMHGPNGINQVGHREYVGGEWKEIGRLQFDFLVKQGLKPCHCFLDIGCGALRGGVHFIRFLDRGNYLGIDKEAMLIDAGIYKELGRELHAEKAPELLVSNNFEFRRFSKVPSFGLAQSLFTHLTGDDIDFCLRQLRQFVGEGFRFYATFFKSNSTSKNPKLSHDHMNCRYTRQQMLLFGEGCGWQSNYLGDWCHPRNQMMMEYVGIGSGSTIVVDTQRMRSFSE